MKVIKRPNHLLYLFFAALICSCANNHVAQKDRELPETKAVVYSQDIFNAKLYHMEPSCKREIYEVSLDTDRAKLSVELREIDGGEKYFIVNFYQKDGRHLYLSLDHNDPNMWVCLSTLGMYDNRTPKHEEINNLRKIKKTREVHHNLDELLQDGFKEAHEREKWFDRPGKLKLKTYE